MTREEALGYFKRRKKILGLSDEVQEAEDMAIKALEQEPCKASEYDKDHIWYKGRQYISLRRFLEVKKEQEPKTGHWDKGYTFPDGEYWMCTNCKELIKVKYPMNYCNNCGSKNE